MVCCAVCAKRLILAIFSPVGIPTLIRVSTITHKDFLFVPCQIMDYLINPVLKSKAQREYASLKRKELEEEEIESSVTYFPALQTSLPHSWYSGLEISDVAAKYGDAKVLIQLWYKRITLIWPQLKPIIPKLRKWLLNRLCRKLFLEFKEYMYNTYGTTWTRFLLKLTQTRSRIGILGGFGKGSIKSVLELQPGVFMQDVVEGR